jgi:hypothetical protein
VLGNPLHVLPELDRLRAELKDASAVADDAVTRWLDDGSPLYTPEDQRLCAWAITTGRYELPAYEKQREA